MDNIIDYIENKFWIQKKIQLQEYFNKLEPKHSIVSSLGIPLKYSGYFALIPSNLDLEAHLAQYPITDYMFVKDNNGIIRSVSRYGGIGPSLKFDPVRFIYILGLISSIPARNKDSITENGYVSINSRLIRNFFKDYLSYLDYLVLTGVLETDGQYIQGKQSKGYKFTERYANAPLIRYDYPAFLQSTDNVASIQEEIYNKETGDFVHNPILDFPYLSYWYSTKGLQIDEEAALNYAYQMMQDKISKGIQSWDINRDKSRNNLIKRKNPLTQYHAALYNINSIAIGDYKVSIDSNVHRLHSVITNLQKNYRRFLSYNGQKLVNVDISNSQPYLLCLLLNPSFWDKASDIPLNIGMLSQNILGMIQEENLSEIYKYVLSISACHDTALENYIQTVSQGKVYEYMQEVINKRESVNLKRDDIKTMILTTLFSKNRFMPTYKKYFKQSFPQIYELIRLVKKENHETLACILQNIESEIILHRCCLKIWDENNHQIPIFTIHDSICTTAGNEGCVYNTMLQTLTENMGFPPHIKIETLAI